MTLGCSGSNSRLRRIQASASSKRFSCSSRRAWLFIACAVSSRSGFGGLQAGLGHGAPFGQGLFVFTLAFQFMAQVHARLRKTRQQGQGAAVGGGGVDAAAQGDASSVPQLKQATCKWGDAVWPTQVSYNCAACAAWPCPARRWAVSISHCSGWLPVAACCSSAPQPSAWTVALQFGGGGGGHGRSVARGGPRGGARRRVRPGLTQAEPGLWGDARRAPSATAAANEAQSSVISAR